MHCLIRMRTRGRRRHCCSRGERVVAGAGTSGAAHRRQRPSRRRLPRVHRQSCSQRPSRRRLRRSSLCRPPTGHVFTDSRGSTGVPPTVSEGEGEGGEGGRGRGRGRGWRRHLSECVAASDLSVAAATPLPPREPWLPRSSARRRNECPCQPSRRRRRRRRPRLGRSRCMRVLTTALLHVILTGRLGRSPSHLPPSLPARGLGRRPGHPPCASEPRNRPSRLRRPRTVRPIREIARRPTNRSQRHYS